MGGGRRPWDRCRSLQPMGSAPPTGSAPPVGDRRSPWGRRRPWHRLCMWGSPQPMGVAPPVGSALIWPPKRPNIPLGRSKVGTKPRPTKAHRGCVGRAPPGRWTKSPHDGCPAILEVEAGDTRTSRTTYALPTTRSAPSGLLVVHGGRRAISLCHHKCRCGEELAVARTEHLPAHGGGGMPCYGAACAGTPASDPCRHMVSTFRAAHGGGGACGRAVNNGGCPVRGGAAIAGQTRQRARPGGHPSGVLVSSGHPVGGRRQPVLPERCLRPWLGRAPSRSSIGMRSGRGILCRGMRPSAAAAGACARGPARDRCGTDRLSAPRSGLRGACGCTSDRPPAETSAGADPN